MRIATGPLFFLVNILVMALLCSAAHAVEDTCVLGTAHPTEKLYQLHSDGKIFVKNDQACTTRPCFGGWFLLDQNPNTVSIAAYCELYQIHNDGAIFHYTGKGIAQDECKSAPCLHWEQLDQNANTKTIAVSIVGDQPDLYQLHKDGMIFRKNGNPCKEQACFGGWDLIDRNKQTVAIAAGTTFLYQLHDDGSIYVYDRKSTCTLDTPCLGWTQLDQSKDNAQIVAGGKLYRMRKDRTIFHYTGGNEPCLAAPCPNWEQISQDPTTVMIKAGAHTLYRFTSDGRILRHNGGNCQTGDCSRAWDQLGQNPNTTAITAGDRLYQMRSGQPGIFRYNEGVCGHTS